MSRLVARPRENAELMMTDVRSKPAIARRPGWSPDIPKGWALAAVIPMVVLLGMFVVYPLVYLIIDSAADGFEAYGRILTTQSGQKALQTTFFSSFLVTLVVLVAATLIAWTLRTTQRTWVKILCWSSILVPFWMGVIVKNYAIILIISADGIINSVLGFMGLEPVRLMYTTTAVVIGIAYSLLPFAVLALFPVFQTVDLNLIRMAETMGSTRSGAIMRVMVPLSTPGFIAAGALVFALSVGFYVTPVVLGGAQAPFLASLIQLNIFNFFDYRTAAALSVILLVTATVVMLAALALVGWKTVARAVVRS